MPNLKKPKVLIAEDHAINQEVIKAILSHYEYAYMVANNGLEAVELLQQQAFDVVLMDVQMPVMDGCQAAIEIRKREAISGTRVHIIAITASASKDDREVCLAAGMDDYMTKPIDAQILMAKLKLRASGVDYSKDTNKFPPRKHRNYLPQALAYLMQKA